MGAGGGKLCGCNFITYRSWQTTFLSGNLIVILNLVQDLPEQNRCPKEIPKQVWDDNFFGFMGTSTPDRETSMQLPPDMAMQWLTYDPVQVGTRMALLTQDERERVSTFGHAGRKRSFVLGRAAARLLLAERLGMAPAQVPLQVAEDGGVDVVGTATKVSIAHSGDHAVAVVADRRVGIDLEGIAPRHEGLPRFLLHPEERPAFEALPLEEATLKALRTGFRRSPKKLRLDVDVPAQTARVHLLDRPPMHLQFEERGGYYMAVAFDYS